jgi:hypothetical protein
MNTAPSTLRSFLLGRARRLPAVVDPADMGTCFGLEMTLDQPPLHGAPAVPVRRSWWQLLSTRRSTSA